MPLRHHPFCGWLTCADVYNSADVDSRSDVYDRSHADNRSDVYNNSDVDNRPDAYNRSHVYDRSDVIVQALLQPTHVHDLRGCLAI